MPCFIVMCTHDFMNAKDRPIRNSVDNYGFNTMTFGMNVQVIASPVLAMIACWSYQVYMFISKDILVVLRP